MGYFTKKILLWLIANAVLPIVFPAFFLAIVAWIKDGSFPLVHLTVQLIQEGFYVFSALTLVFSLYEDYDLTKRCVTPMMQSWLVFMSVLTSLMFYVMRQDPSAEYMSKNLFQFFTIWILTAISTITVKYKILKLKSNLSV